MKIRIWWFMLIHRIKIGKWYSFVTTYWPRKATGVKHHEKLGWCIVMDENVYYPIAEGWPFIRCPAPGTTPADIKHDDLPF